MLKYFLFSGLLLLGPLVFSQISFVESTSSEIEGVWYFGTIDFADIDGDNDLDLLIGGRDNNNNVVTKLYNNDGNGIFSELTDNPLASYFQGNSNFADIDGDGDKDLFLAGSWGGNARMYKNDGSGNFIEIEDTPFIGFSYNTNVFFDIDKDSDLDLIISGRRDSDFSPITRMYKNDGTGNFTLIVQTGLENLRRSTAAQADVDGDDDLDIIIAGETIGENKITILYLNDGNGNFTPDSYPFHGIVDGTIKFVDVDNDNDQDVFITDFSKSRLYINDGQGKFSEKLNTTFNGYKMDASDVDGDGTIDVVFLANEECSLFTNDGNGNFTKVLDTPFDATRIGNVKFADVDGDNDPDILITGRENETDIQITKLYINEGLLPSSLNESNYKITSLHLFPNPGIIEKLYVEFNFRQNVTVKIEIFNINGNKVLSQNRYILSDEKVISINTNNLAAGKYTVKLQQGNQLAYGTFIKLN